MTVAKAPKAKTRAPAPAAVREVMIAGRPRDRYDEILALQRAAGNRAVSQLLQAKVGIGGPGNRYEREADRAACQESPAGSLPAGIEAVVRGGGGQPLDPDTRDYMESRFGADFGYVRVHNDAQARASAASLGARAFTYGNHVAFGTNGFAPHDASGRHLLAHELAHVVQQSADRTGSFLPASDTSSEREADAAAHSAIAGRSAQVHMRTGIRIARQPQSPLSIPGEGD